MVDHSKSQRMLRAWVLFLTWAFCSSTPLHAKLYWTSADGIHCANLNGTDEHVLIGTVLASPGHIALDVEAGKLYLTDPVSHKILRADLDGTNVETILDTGIDAPKAIALDLRSRQIYWSGVRPYGNVVAASLHRVSMDGERAGLVYGPGDLEFIGDIGVSSGAVYWSVNESIWRVGINGEQAQAFLNGGLETHSAKLAVAEDETVFYRTTLSGDITRTDLSGMRSETLFTGLGDLISLCLDERAGRLYWATSYGIWQGNLDGTGTETVFTELSEITDFALDTANARVYWVETFEGAGRLKRASLDGTQVEVLDTGGITGATDVAVEPERGKLYWTSANASSGAATLQRSNLAGRGVESLATASLGAAGIALDAQGRKIYWGSSGSVWRADLDGTDAEIIFGSGRSVKDLAIDPVDGKLYCAIQGGMVCLELDGTQAEELPIQVDFPQGLAIDTRGRRLYWTQARPYEIRRSLLNGASVQTVLSGYSATGGIEVDPVQGKVYWTDAQHFDGPPVGFIRRADLDGTEVETVYRSFLQPVRLALIPDGSGDTSPHPMQPDQKPTAIWARLRGGVLLPSYPNPCRGETQISFYLPGRAGAHVRIYDSSGRLLRELSSTGLGLLPYEQQPYTLSWDGTNDVGIPVPNGVYFYDLIAEGFRATRKLVVIR